MAEVGETTGTLTQRGFERRYGHHLAVKAQQVERLPTRRVRHATALTEAIAEHHDARGLNGSGALGHKKYLL
jgi:hypothetical protein